MNTAPALASIRQSSGNSGATASYHRRTSRSDYGTDIAFIDREVSCRWYLVTRVPRTGTLTSGSPSRPSEEFRDVVFICRVTCVL